MSGLFDIKAGVNEHEGCSHRDILMAVLGHPVLSSMLEKGYPQLSHDAQNIVNVESPVSDLGDKSSPDDYSGPGFHN